MVQAPSHLKQILDAESPEEMYRALRRNRMLRSTSRADKQRILDVIRTTLEQPSRSSGPAMPGPSGMDSLASELVPFLNQRGIQARSAPPVPESELARPGWFEFF